MKVSACCIIKDEEKNLTDYIEGVKCAADEIIIVDTGSTDNSVKLLEELKEKYNLSLTIYNFEWINDFAAAKNFAIEKASGDWIIFCDADEHFKEGDREKLRPLLEELDPDLSFIGIDTPRYNIDIDDNNKVTSNDTVIRVFRNDPNLRYKGEIHEALDYTGERKVQYFESNLEMLHTGYSDSIIAQKNARNIKIILATKDKGDKNNIGYNFYLAVAYLSKMDYKEAEKNIKKAIKIMKRANHYFLTDAYRIYIAIKELQNRPYKEIHELIMDALKFIPDHPDFLTLRLLRMLELGEYEDAEKISKTILRKSEDKVLRKKYINKIDLELPYAHYALGLCNMMKGNKSEALREFLTALKSYRYRDYFLKVILVLLSGREDLAEEIILKYYDPKRDAAFLSKVVADRPPHDRLYQRFYIK